MGPDTNAMGFCGGCHEGGLSLQKHRVGCILMHSYDTVFPIVYMTYGAQELWHKLRRKSMNIGLVNLWFFPVKATVADIAKPWAFSSFDAVVCTLRRNRMEKRKIYPPVHYLNHKTLGEMRAGCPRGIETRVNMCPS